MKDEFYYPEQLTRTVRLGLWKLRDAVLILLALVVSLLAAFRGGSLALLTGTLVFAFLTVRPEEDAVGDLIGRLVRFLILPDTYERPAGGETEKRKETGERGKA